MDSTHNWQRVWSTLVKDPGLADRCEFDEIFNMMGNDLKKGVLMYRPYSTESNYSALRKLNIQDRTNMKTLLIKSSISLNLDGEQTWAVFCNYLMFSYYGSIENVNKLITFQDVTVAFIKKLWNFYTMERTFLLQSLRHVVENMNTDHRYSAFRESVSPVELRSSLIEQLKYLIEELPLIDHSNFILHSKWLYRNNREQQAILILILTTMGNNPLAPSEAALLVDVFLWHSFTHTPTYQNSIVFGPTIEFNNTELTSNIRSMELVIVMSAFNHLWETPEHHSIFERLFLQVRDTNYPFVPVIQLLYGCMHYMTEGTNVAGGRHILEALKKNVLYFLTDLISRDIFKENIAGTVAKSAVFEFAKTVFRTFTETTLRTYYSEAVGLVGELIELDECFTDAFTDDAIKPIVDMAWTMFPLDFRTLTRLSEKLAMVPFRRHTLIESLSQLNTYTVSVTERGLGSVPIIFKPFNNDILIIRSNTLSVLFGEGDDCIATMQGTYSYFRVILGVATNAAHTFSEQSMVSSNYEQILITGFEFLLTLLEQQHELVVNTKMICDSLKLSQFMLDATAHVPTIQKHLLSICIRICRCQLEHPDIQLISLAVISRYLPKVQEPINDLQCAYVDDSLLETLAISDPSLLLDYVKLITVAVERDVEAIQLQIPGIIYLASRVLQNYVGSLLTLTGRKSSVCVSLIQLFDLVIAKPALDSQSCLHTWLKYNRIFHGAIFGLLGIGNIRLTIQLGQYPYWEQKQATDVLLTIRRGLKIMATILRPGRVSNTGLLARCAYQDLDHPSLLRFIYGYINHGVDKIIPLMACLTLEVFVKESELPLHICLEIDSQQVRTMFLEKLQDPIENDNLKLNIMSFMSACMDKQEFLFSSFLIDQPEWNCSLTNFMANWLPLAVRQPEILNERVHAGVLKFLNQICKLNTAASLHLTNFGNFWETLYDLCRAAIGIVETGLITQIVEVFTCELNHRKLGVSQSFRNSIRMFMDPGSKVLESIVSSYLPTGLFDDQRLRLTTFLKRTVLYTSMYCPECLGDEFWPYFRAICWGKLIESATVGGTHFLRQWGRLIVQLDMRMLPDEDLIETATAFFVRLLKVYGQLKGPIKNICLTIGLRVSLRLRDYDFNQHLLPLLEPIGILFHAEYVHLTSKPWCDPNDYDPFLTLVNIFNNFLIHMHREGVFDYYSVIGYCSKVGHFVRKTGRNPVLSQLHDALYQMFNSYNYTRYHCDVRRMLVSQD